ncbi:MAG: glycosyltransferase [Nanoarchaeota archaeon]
MKKASIIIPCKEIDELTDKCVRECLKLDYDNFEILLLPDIANKKYNDKRLKIIKTGHIKPSAKRNLGMEKATGNFFAFIDSDAYPSKDWLKNAIRYFEDEKIGIVGGPNLTPPNVNFAEKISGYVLSNFLATGPACVRYKIEKNQYVKELPSCNYISRREISPKYDVNFLTAEDSEFCFKISEKGYKILYAKDVVVYHHRRDSLKKHIKQMYIYGRDIAWLTKKDFSFDKLYFSLLTLFVLGIVAGIFLSFFNPLIKNIFLVCLCIYIILMASTNIHENFKVSFFCFATTITTHFAYGLGWLKGILVKQEKV